MVATGVGSVPGNRLNSAELGIIVDPAIEAIHLGLRTALARSWSPENLVVFASTRTWDNVAAGMEEFLRHWSQEPNDG